MENIQFPQIWWHLVHDDAWYPPQQACKFKGQSFEFLFWQRGQKPDRKDKTMQYIHTGKDKKEPKASTTTTFPVVEELN